MKTLETIQFFEFGEFRLSLRDKCLWRGGAIVPLTPKAVETLFALVEKHGELLTKEELLERVWADTFVEEIGLARNISVLRKTLGEEFIETVPRRGYRFVGEVREISGANSAANSLAVVPFRVISERAEDEHLGIGLADILITHLSNFRRLVVRPTGAAASAAGKNKSPFEIGRELNVEWVLGGTVLRLGEGLRLTVQLVNVAEQRSVWGGRFETGLTSLLSLQDALAEQLGQTLIETLKLPEQPFFYSGFTANSEAHRAYLRGRALWNRRTKESLVQAAAAFEQAIKLDSNFALAYTGLSDCLILFDNYAVTPPHECFPQARQAAEIALSLNVSLAEAHTSLAFVNYRFEWDWKAAEREFQKALALNPNYAAARHWYGLFLTAMRRFTEALEQFDYALSLDPLSIVYQTSRLLVFYFQRDFEPVLQNVNQTIALNPNHHYALSMLASVLSHSGDHTRAIEAAERAAVVAERKPAALGALGIVYARAGKKDEAKTVLRELHEAAKTNYINSYQFVGINAVLGNNDEALRWLKIMFNQRDGNIPYLNVYIDIENLRKDKRFVELIQQLNFSEN